MSFSPDTQGASARVAPRLLAAVVDWLICLFIPLILAGLFVPVLWFVIVPLSVVAYFGFFLTRGRSPGMRAASLRVVDRRTGRAPSVARALARALVALLQAVALFVLLYFALSDTPSGGYSAADLAVLAVSLLVSLSSLAGHLWMFFDRERQTLLDRLFGLAVESWPRR